MLAWSIGLETHTAAGPLQGPGLGKGTNTLTLVNILGERGGRRRVAGTYRCLTEGERSHAKTQGKTRSIRVRTSQGNLSLDKQK